MGLASPHRHVDRGQCLPQVEKKKVRIVIAQSNGDLGTYLYAGKNYRSAKESATGLPQVP